jgi:tellurite resistance protein TerC
VFASNAMAILGLRALYFLLIGAADKLVYLDKGLAVILAFVGVKMLLVEWYHLPTPASLGFITVVLTITVVASLRATKAHEAALGVAGGAHVADEKQPESEEQHG